MSSAAESGELRRIGKAGVCPNEPRDLHDASTDPLSRGETSHGSHWTGPACRQQRVSDQRGRLDDRGLGELAPAARARSREVGVATEMLLTKAKQVSDDGGCAAWITP
jgi:hypothetical protein